MLLVLNKALFWWGGGKRKIKRTAAWASFSISGNLVESFEGRERLGKSIELKVEVGHERICLLLRA